MGIHILEIFVANSFYLYMKNTTRPNFSTMKEYKEAILRVLVGPAKPSTKIKIKLIFIIYVLYSAPRKRRHQQEHVNTVQQKNTEKESRYQCLKCSGKPALCIHQYFHLYHKKIGVAQTEPSSENEQD